MTYRPEIDGLRAFAVLPVILFHAGFEAFSGGFVGVDVFFVISGYLITSLILAEKQAGTFTLLNFYERRARRILPALFFVMALCIPFAWIWLLPKEMQEFSQSLVAVSLFFSNHFFLGEIGYWDTAAELKPLLHTWSLAVEEQYYALFPLLLMLAWRFGKRWTVVLMAALAAISLALAQWGAYSQPTTAFYLLPTRGWELLLGALTSIYSMQRVRPIVSLPIGQTASFVGLAIVLCAVFAFSKNTPFPGFYALLPTIGAALIILFATPATVAGRILSNKAISGVGLVSYSAYLWHQPLFAFARYSIPTEPPKFVFLLLSLFSIGMAFVSWHFVESPFRRKDVISRTQLSVFAGCASAFFIAFGLVGHFSGGFSSRFEGYETAERQFVGHTLRRHCDVGDDGQGWGMKFCVLGAKSAEQTPSVAVFGDSHANELNPVFDLLGKKYGVGVAHIGVGGSPCVRIVVASIESTTLGRR